jgi:hypothetical protein
MGTLTPYSIIQSIVTSNSKTKKKDMTNSNLRITLISNMRRKLETNSGRKKRKDIKRRK